MKTLLATTLALTTLNGFAASLKIVELNGYARYVDSSFAVNESLGRAWVEVTTDEGISESAYSTERVKVPGLSLVGDTIVLELEGQNVECAKVRTVGRIFSRREVKATGNCNFTVLKASRSYDDGFEVRTVKTLLVNLVTK